MLLCIVIHSADKKYRHNCVLLYLVWIDFMKNYSVFLNLSYLVNFPKEIISFILQDKGKRVRNACRY